MVLNVLGWYRPLHPAKSEQSLEKRKRLKLIIGEHLNVLIVQKGFAFSPSPESTCSYSGCALTFAGFSIINSWQWCVSHLFDTIHFAKEFNFYIMLEQKWETRPKHRPASGHSFPASGPVLRVSSSETLTPASPRVPRGTTFRCCPLLSGLSDLKREWSELQGRAGQQRGRWPRDWLEPPSLQQGSREQRPGLLPPCRGMARDSCQMLLEASVLFYKCDLLIKRFLFFGNRAVLGTITFSPLRTRVHIS